MTESELLSLLTSRPTRTELARLMGMSEDGAKYWIRKLRDKGHNIVAVGRLGQYRYELLKGKP